MHDRQQMNHLEPHRRYLWALLYRLTGCAADADDLVQDTFVRALEKPPADLDASLRPWLVRVAVNLGKDQLRRRRRAPYVGPWLPSPIETDASHDHEACSPPSYELTAADGIDTQGRYDLVESVSYAFLVALEVLTPQQRAVLLLRDVFDYSIAETAEVLGIGSSNVKTTLHRARRAMRGYESERVTGTAQLERVERATRDTIERFLGALAARDAGAIEELLAADVVATADSGGEFIAARKIVRGAAAVAKYFLGVSRGGAAGFEMRVRVINGLPACVVTMPPSAGRRLAPRLVTRMDLDQHGKVRAVHSVLATRKLTAIAE